MNVLTITQLNNLIKRTLDREYLLKNLYVSGTIINAKRVIVVVTCISR